MSPKEIGVYHVFYLRHERKMVGGNERPSGKMRQARFDVSQAGVGFSCSIVGEETRDFGFFPFFLLFLGTR
ncbi:Protein CBG27666 [Caenorhabditis briggsae]|uniref:Protein CBG27666 n=1 Tax=Caenorhabditis briggsae TaxID=6238 RepID=B6IJB1_CAEBR|nr:Protein CBG27666 [Caenorhabditis briggsae]CAR99945.1 Protein CBG27666 [Caenorhabditis briggsae]